MPSPVETYVAEVAGKYATGRAGEHAYRAAFEKLIATLDPRLKIVNDPKRTEHGAPDFVFVRGELTAGYAETKDVGVSLDKTEKTEQMERYLGYSKLILTDYLEFRFFHNGQKYEEPIVIGTLKGGRVLGVRDQYEKLADTLKDFLNEAPEQIQNGARLAEIMGGKARRVRDNVRQYLVQHSERNRELERIFETVKSLLVHDLSLEHFADMYAQTLVYGLFAARFHDTSKEPFTRQKARDLIPASNPFLRHFFDHIVGPDFDVRLAYIVNELCEVFSLANVHALMGQYFKKNGEVEGPDPVIHFYEDFLREYDPEQRKKIGAFYTPVPVVRFIVRAVDAILERDFGLPRGLADTSKIPIEQVRQGRKAKTDVHRVQILDPATGTGTFLNETIRAIAKRFQGQEGRWSTYVDNDLLPRLYGFELMMASYTIAHLKLGMTLEESGYKRFNKRLGIYLTNSLEQGELPDDTLFGFGLSRSIAEEAREAAVIKRETPIMVVLGNPPYSVSSSNKSKWILDLIKDYKTNLDEKKLNLDDDYIKFIRLAEHFIETNVSGIVALITNNSYIDGITHRQMRKHLRDTFDDIYVLDLHGNSKRKEKAPDGTRDENVFDIQQGVAIAIFIKRATTKKAPAVVHHSELYGTRSTKFNALNALELSTVPWAILSCAEPGFFFVPKDLRSDSSSDDMVSLSSVFRSFGNGIGTDRDSLFYDFEDDALTSRMEIFYSQHGLDDDFREKFNVANSSSYNLLDRRNATTFDPESIQLALYRPFDVRWLYYDPKLTSRPAQTVMQHLKSRNLALLVTRQISTGDFRHVFITDKLCDRDPLSVATRERTQVFPLYLYASDGTRISNLSPEVERRFRTILGNITPEDIFDYIYAVLYSPDYREKYKEFLKIDFPRVPYPADKSQFEQLVALGRELRALHLLESPKVGRFVTTYPVSGSNVVEKIEYKEGSVYINKSQYVGNVPAVAWNFWVGGYQPAQKWLKDRKGRALTNADIEHYQKMIVALSETDRIMREIDPLLT